jgi:hypothetical protein
MQYIQPMVFQVAEALADRTELLSGSCAREALSVS